VSLGHFVAGEGTENEIFSSVMLTVSPSFMGCQLKYISVNIHLLTFSLMTNDFIS